MKTTRTLLRRLTWKDLPSIIELESDPEVMRFTRSGVAKTVPEIEERLRGWTARETELAPLGIWAAEELGSGRFVGWFMLLRTESEFPELGYMLPRRAWSCGYATEVCAGLVAYAFRDLGLEAISAVTGPDNLASMRVLEKIGFVRTGDGVFLLRRPSRER